MLNENQLRAVIAPLNEEPFRLSFQRFPESAEFIGGCQKEAWLV